MVTHNFSLVDDTRKWGVMRHFFSLAVLWEAMGRHCPCFTCAGALQERPPLSLPLSREMRSPQDLSSKKRTGEGWLRSAVPQLSCSLMKHSALRVRSRAGGWTSLLLLHQQFPSQGRGEQVCPAPCPPTVSMEVDAFAQLPSPEMGWGHS